MAVDLGDASSGFRHSEVVLFINEEVLNNGGGLDFYLTFRSRPWNEIEDELRSIIADPQVSRATKRACTWSALALNVRVVARQLEQQAHQVRRLQEQVGERETAAWALASQLQRLHRERDFLVSQLRRVQEDLRQVLNDGETVRPHQLQAQRWPQEVVPESRPQGLGYDVWPMNADERNEALAKVRQRRKDVDSQREVAQREVAQREVAQTASTTSVLYGPGTPSPGAHDVPLPMPMPLTTPFPMVVPYTPPPPPTVVSGTAAAAAAAGTTSPPQMPTGVIYPSGMCPAFGFQEDIALLQDQRSQDQEEGPVRTHFINPSGRSWSQEDPRKQQPQ